MTILNSITSVPIRKINQFRKNIFIRIYYKIFFCVGVKLYLYLL